MNRDIIDTVDRIVQRCRVLKRENNHDAAYYIAGAAWLALDDATRKHPYAIELREIMCGHWQDDLFPKAQ